MRISDWSSDVCSSDLHFQRRSQQLRWKCWWFRQASHRKRRGPSDRLQRKQQQICSSYKAPIAIHRFEAFRPSRALRINVRRSEEHTSELQSLMRISYAVFCLKKKITLPKHITSSH